MAEAGTIEVPVRLRPEAVIPFHQGELLRVEMGRTTLVGPPLDRVAVRSRDCDVVVDGQRLRGVQSIVVIERRIAPVGRRQDGPVFTPPQRLIGVTIKTKTPEAKESVEWIMRRPETMTAVVQVKHPDTGEVIVELGTSAAILMKHAWEPEDDEPADPGYVWFDFIGTPPR